MEEQEVWEIANKDPKVAEALQLVMDNSGGYFMSNRQKLILAQAIVIKYKQEQIINEGIGVERSKSRSKPVCEERRDW